MALQTSKQQHICMNWDSRKSSTMKMFSISSQILSIYLTECRKRWYTKYFKREPSSIKLFFRICKIPTEREKLPHSLLGWNWSIFHNFQIFFTQKSFHFLTSTKLLPSLILNLYVTPNMLPSALCKFLNNLPLSISIRIKLNFRFHQIKQQSQRQA